MEKRSLWLRFLIFAPISSVAIWVKLNRIGYVAEFIVIIGSQA